MEKVRCSPPAPVPALNDYRIDSAYCFRVKDPVHLVLEIDGVTPEDQMSCRRRSAYVLKRLAAPIH